MRRISVCTTILVASVTLGACDQTAVVMGELNEAEAADLAGAVMLATFDATGSQPAAAPGGPAMVPFESTAHVEVDVQCPLGGTVAVTADAVVNGDTETTAGTVDYAMTQVHHECGVMSENDRHFVLSGTPGLTLDLVVASNGQGVVEWGGTVSGAVTWQNDGREGTCEVSLEFSARHEAGVSFDADLAGVVCGFDVARTLNVGGGDGVV